MAGCTPQTQEQRPRREGRGPRNHVGRVEGAGEATCWGNFTGRSGLRTRECGRNGASRVPDAAHCLHRVPQGELGGHRGNARPDVGRGALQSLQEGAAGSGAPGDPHVDRVERAFFKARISSLYQRPSYALGTLAAGRLPSPTAAPQQLPSKEGASQTL